MTRFPNHIYVVSLLVALALLSAALAVRADVQTVKLKHGFRPPRNGGVYVVAHRGAHNGIPENSLPAYQKAIDLGADFVEIDVRTTKDGKFVSVHNSTIDSYVVGESGRVQDFTLAELKAFDIGERVDSKWKGTRIPTLDEILKLCKGKIGIYLDLKSGPVDKLVEVIKQHDMQRDVLWYASYEKLDSLREICPKCIPMPDPFLELNLRPVLRRFKPVVVASYCDKISPRFLRTCHEAGAIVIADETSPDDWGKVLQWGLDGIQTDHPMQLIQFLQRRTAAEE